MKKNKQYSEVQESHGGKIHKVSKLFSDFKVKSKSKCFKN